MYARLFTGPFHAAYLVSLIVLLKISEAIRSLVAPLVVRRAKLQINSAFLYSQSSPPVFKSQAVSEDVKSHSLVLPNFVIPPSVTRYIKFPHILHARK